MPKQPVDAALGRHPRLPLGCGERDTAARDDLAVVVLGGRGDGDELVVVEAGVEEPDESVVDRRRQAGPLAGRLERWRRARSSLRTGHRPARARPG